MFTTGWRWFKRSRGATVSEYMVILLLAAMVLLVGLRLFGDTVKDKFTGASDEIAHLGESGESGLGAGAGGDDSRRASAGSGGDSADSSVGGGASHQGGSAASGSSSSGKAMADASGAGPPPEGTCALGGFNLLVILVFGGLMGLLGYVVFGKKADG